MIVVGKTPKLALYMKFSHYIFEQIIWVDTLISHKLDFLGDLK